MDDPDVEEGGDGDRAVGEDGAAAGEATMGDSVRQVGVGATGHMGADGRDAEGPREESEGLAGAREGEGGWTREESDIMDAYSVPDGFTRIAKPSSFPNNCIAQGLHVLMRFTRTRAVW